MHPLSRVVPKELLPLGRKPVLHHVVEELAGAGVANFHLITSERTSAVERYFSDDSELDAALRKAGIPTGWHAGDEHLASLSFRFIRQDEPRGVSAAVHLARPFVAGKPFFLHMGDSVLTGDPDILNRMADLHERYGAACVVAVKEMPTKEISAHGTVVARGDTRADVFEIEGIIEKPAAHEITIQGGLSGRYLISTPMLTTPMMPEPRFSPFGGLGAIFPERGELEGPILAVWCREGATLHDIGTLDNYLRAQAFFAHQDRSVEPDTTGQAREAV